jgi:hypothetical protein
MDIQHLDKIAEGARNRLKELLEAFAKTFAEDLLSVLLYGSASRGAYRPRDSNINLLIVLREAKREKLAFVSHAMQLARMNSRIECLVVQESELLPTATLFPLLYRDMQRHHHVLYGKDIFTEFLIPETHIRVRIAQELQEAQLLLRRTIVDGMGSPAAIASAVETRLKLSRSTLYELLRLAGYEGEDDLPSVVVTFMQHRSLNPVALDNPRANPGLAYDTFMYLMTSAQDLLQSL